jgi:hypothetical protein
MTFLVSIDSNGQIKKLRINIYSYYNGMLFHCEFHLNKIVQLIKQLKSNMCFIEQVQAEKNVLKTSNKSV